MPVVDELCATPRRAPRIAHLSPTLGRKGREGRKFMGRRAPRIVHLDSTLPRKGVKTSGRSERSERYGRSDFS
eukprot:5388673-Prymnesium_polylepis.1